MTQPTVTLPLSLARVERIDSSRPTLVIPSRNTIDVYVRADDFEGEKTTAIKVNAGRVFITLLDPDRPRRFTSDEKVQLEIAHDKLASINAKHMLGVDAIMLGHAENIIEKLLEPR